MSEPEDVVNFEIGMKRIMHPPDGWDGSPEMLIAWSHDEGEPCAICREDARKAHATVTVTEINRETGIITVSARHA